MDYYSLDDLPESFFGAAFAYFGVFAISFVLFLAASVGNINRFLDCRHKAKRVVETGGSLRCSLSVGLFAPAAIVFLIGMLLTLWLYFQAIRRARHVKDLMARESEEDEAGSNP